MPEIIVSGESLGTLQRHRPVPDPVALVPHEHDGDVPVVGVDSWRGCGRSALHQTPEEVRPGSDLTV